MPVPKPRKEGTDPYHAKKTDSEAVAEWRQRMGTAEAKAIYKERASTIETVNAELKTERGLTPFRVRGVPKVRCVALWCALALTRALPRGDRRQLVALLGGVADAAERAAAVATGTGGRRTRAPSTKEAAS